MTGAPLAAWFLLPERLASVLRLGLDDLAATVKAVGADVVAQVNFARGGFFCNAGGGEGIVRAVHSALGRRFFVLLNSHDGSL